MALFNRSGEVRPISLRRSLMLLVAVCVLPAVALGIYGAFDRFGLYKQQISAQTQRIAESLISEIDRDRKNKRPSQEAQHTLGLHWLP